MRVGLVVARKVRGAIEIARDISNKLLKEKNEVYIYPPTHHISADVKRVNRIEDLNVDIAVSIGGDGTVLRTFLYLPNKDTPVLSIGLGERNFLSTVDKEGYKRAIEKLLRNEYEIREEMRLDVRIENFQGVLPPVLNEVVFASRITGKTCDVHLGIIEEGETKLLWHSKADGIIIATPLGSTAYAYSAGGPVIDSDLSGILVVPILPVMRKPVIVVKPDRILAVWASSMRSPPLLILDGQIRLEVDYEQKVYVKRSKYNAKFIITDKYSSITRLIKASR